MVVAVAMARREPRAQEQLLSSRWWYDPLPPWLPVSNLSSCMTLGQWALYQALVMVDHHQMGREDRTGQLIKVTQRELEIRTGLVAETIRQGTQWLLQHRFLDYYRPGRTQKPGWYRVDRGMIREIYRYVAPILEVEHMGMRGLDRDQIPDEGIIIYGKPKCRPLIAEWAELQAWLMAAEQQRERLPRVPQSVEIRRIVENYVENHPQADWGAEAAPPTSLGVTPNLIGGGQVHPQPHWGWHPQSRWGCHKDRES